MHRPFHRQEPPSVYRGVVLGLTGSVLGVLAMGQYWTKVAPLLSDSSQGDDDAPDQNVISPLGQQHEPGESSTAALGRFAYQAVTGKTPGKETRAALSEAVHWGFGVLSGAAFGAITARQQKANPLTGAAFGAAMWAVFDEGMVPLLGLQDGPAASPVSGHLNRLGAHLSYGAALGLGVWALGRVLPKD
ncbi:DUF1440 domain-containing protein [Deinococcus ruber]|uniref:DUF1440 domain-containing protein n=1 Tax=Deinococcus ruber TaxID=1848197 RepID=UPI0016695743|nr:DUF1440 domain-containing protein [Deinococcus ruber]